VKSTILLKASYNIVLVNMGNAKYNQLLSIFLFVLTFDLLRSILFHIIDDSK
jgi:hypothetical protein